MTLLLVITGLLLVGSGLLALRTAARLSLGVPLLALVQVLAGLLVPMLGLLLSVGRGTGATLVGGSFLLIVVSAVWQARRVNAARRARLDSEGARLMTRIRYPLGDP